MRGEKEETRGVKSQINKPSHCESECKQEAGDLQALLPMRGDL